MNVPKKTIILVAIAAIIFIIAVICFIFFGGKKNDKPVESSITITKESYDIIGTWYSDREDGDVLTLNTDGSYTSSKWLVRGEFKQIGDIVTLTDIFGDSKKLTTVKVGDSYTLQYAGAASHTYYRTEQEVTTVRDASIATDEDMQSLYNAALMQILTTGEWQDRFGATALFSENHIAFKSADGKSVDYNYQVVSFEVQSGNYYITLNLNDTTNNMEYKDAAFNLIVGDDNTYTLKSSGYVSQEFLYEYTKTIEIIFTQPVNTTGSGTDQGMIDGNNTAESSSEKIIVNEDGSIDRFTQISRDDNPDFSEQMEAAYTAMEAAIYGTWQGTFENFENENTIYWIFTFNMDGTYNFNDDIGNTENGTFILGRNNEEATYISNITFTPQGGNIYTLNFTMTGNPITDLHFDSYGTEKNYPTFKKISS